MPQHNNVIMHDRMVTRFNLCNPLVAIKGNRSKNLILIRLISIKFHYLKQESFVLTLTFAAGGLWRAEPRVDGLFSFPFTVLLGGGPKLGPLILLRPVSILAPTLALPVALWA